MDKNVDEKDDYLSQYCEDCLYWLGNNGVCNTREWETCDMWEQKYIKRDEK